MNKKSVQLKSSTNLIIHIVFGVLISLIVSVILMIAGAILLNNEILGETSINWLTLVVWTLSVLAGTIIQSFVFDVKQIVIPCITALIYMVILISIKILFIDSGFAGIGQGIAAILAGALPSVFVISRSGTGKRKKFKYRAG